MLRKQEACEQVFQPKNAQNLFVVQSQFWNTYFGELWSVVLEIFKGMPMEHQTEAVLRMVLNCMYMVSGSALSSYIGTRCPPDMDNPIGSFMQVSINGMVAVLKSARNGLASQDDFAKVVIRQRDLLQLESPIDPQALFALTIQSVMTQFYDAIGRSSETDANHLASCIHYAQGYQGDCLYGLLLLQQLSAVLDVSVQQDDSTDQCGQFLESVLNTLSIEQLQKLKDLCGEIIGIPTDDSTDSTGYEVFQRLAGRIGCFYVARKDESTVQRTQQNSSMLITVANLEQKNSNLLTGIAKVEDPVRVGFNSI